MKKVLILVSSLFLLPIGFIHAASANIVVDTSGNSINAIQGSVVIPASVHLSSEIHTGDSAISVWITYPKLDQTSGEVDFAGLAPGGFTGKRVIFSIIGDFGTSTINNLNFKNILALKNDGKGTEVPVKMLAQMSSEPSDGTAPEPFAIKISNSEDVFGGREFASWIAQDKGCGIARYEVAEKFVFSPSAKDWKKATSPYQIADTLLIKQLYIKATDYSGNFRIESVSLPRRMYLEILLAIILGSLCVIFVKRSLRQQ